MKEGPMGFSRVSGVFAAYRWIGAGLLWGFASLAWAGPDPALWSAQVRSAKAELDRDPEGAEARLRALLIEAYAAESIDAAMRGEVNALREHRTRVWTTPADPDHGRGQQVPKYPLAATARALLNHWDRLEQARSLAARLSEGQALESVSAVDQRTLIQALALLSVEQRSVALLALAGQGPAKATATGSEEVLAVYALESGRDEVLAAALEQGHGPHSLKLVADLPQALSPEHALAMLEIALGNPALASAATLALANLAPMPEAGLSRLEALLADPELGASAAQALARTGEVEALAVADRSLAGSDRTAQVHALLSLRWRNSPAAQARLGALAEDPRLDADLRSEVATWVR